MLRERLPQPSVSWCLAGNLLQGKTVGIIGAGRIGSAYARMMVEGHKASSSCAVHSHVIASRVEHCCLGCNMYLKPALPSSDTDWKHL